MKAIVTGSSGFVGKNLCKVLKTKGYEITTISKSKTHIPDSHNHILCDLEKENLRDKIFSGVDVIFHLAGYAHDLKDPMQSKERYQRLNVEATKNISIQASREQVKSFIFISSVKAGEKVIDGSPLSIYGKTKREAELFLLNFPLESDMRINIVRPALIYGTDMKGNLKSMLDAVESGWFPPLPEINNKRSMIHIQDLISAILLIQDTKEVDKEVFIATDGREYSTTQIYHTFLELLGKKKSRIELPISLMRLISFAGPRIKHKMDKLLGDEVYDSSKLFQLGFRPRKSLENIRIQIQK